MKNGYPTLVLMFIVQLFIVPFASAQCMTQATGSGNNTAIPSYNIRGDIHVVLDTDNTITLNLGDNFQTASGPDIRAYLINPENFTDTELKTQNIDEIEHIAMGLVGSGTINQNGAKSFTQVIPSNIAVTTLSKVFFYCKEFDQFWDFANFDRFTATSCNVLSTDTFNKEELSIFPNPVKEQLHIQLKSLTAAGFKIFDLNGQLIKSVATIDTTNSQIDLSNLETGLYLLEIKSENKLGYKRLFVN